MPQKWIMRGALESSKGRGRGAAVFALAFLCLSLFILFENVLDGNEQDILPLAKQAVNRGWLPHDWTLNLPSGYRLLFNSIFGFMSLFMSLPAVSVLGRLILFVLFGLLFKEMARLLEMKAATIVPFLFLYLRYDHITAGEWIFRGLETKPFAYLFSFFAIVFLLERKYFRFFLCLGLAFSFHVLIGTFALLSIFAAIALNYRQFKTDLAPLLKNSYIFLVSGSFGIFAAVQNIVLSWDLGPSAVGNIVVGIRAPAIASPIFWQGKWLLKLILTSGFLLATAVLSKRKEVKFIAVFALTTLAYFGIGLAAYHFGRSSLLKFFWFRFPDVILPFFSFLLFFALISHAVSGPTFRRERLQSVAARSRRLAELALVVVTILVLLRGIARSYHAVGEIFQHREHFCAASGFNPNLQNALLWIRTNTSRESVFLADPVIDKFRIIAERAEFVSFKLYPDIEKYVPEWYQRIVYCSNEQNLTTFSSDLEATISRNFYSMDENLIKRIAKEYRLDYYLGSADKEYGFPRVFENTAYAVYDLRRAD
jgi:hypothetical protein